MHFEVELETISKAANFAHAVSKAAGAIADTGNPDHRSIYLSATPQGLIVRCTTRDYQASTLVSDAKIFTFGDCMIYSDRLAKHLETLPLDSNMSFTYDGDLLYIESNKRKGVRSIPGIVPDFAMPEWRLEAGHFSQVVPPDFAQDILFASKYACDDASRTYYGINLDHTGILAFDGFELIKIYRNLPDLPSTTLDVNIAKFIASPKFFGDGDIEFGADGSAFQFRFGNSTLTGPTMGGDFTSARKQIEDLIEPYLNPSSPRKLVFDYKEFGDALASITAGALDPLDRVLIWPNGNLCIGIDRIDNYNETIGILESSMPNPFAVNLRSLGKMFKEGKDDTLTFNFHPSHSAPELRQIMVFAGNRIVGFSPSVVSDKLIKNANAYVPEEPEEELEDIDYDTRNLDEIDQDEEFWS